MHKSIHVIIPFLVTVFQQVTALCTVHQHSQFNDTTCMPVTQLSLIIIVMQTPSVSYLRTPSVSYLRTPSVSYLRIPSVSYLRTPSVSYLRTPSDVEVTSCGYGAGSDAMAEAVRLNSITFRRWPDSGSHSCHVGPYTHACTRTYVQSVYTRTHTCTHARTLARTHARTQTQTYTIAIDTGK